MASKGRLPKTRKSKDNSSPYSPEVNPVEHLWDHIRENYLKNRTFDSLSSIEEELVSILRDLHNDKSTVQSLTGFNWTFFK